MSEYSSAQEDLNEGEAEKVYLDADLVVNEDIQDLPRSGQETVEVSDDERNTKDGQDLQQISQELKKMAFQSKPSNSLTLVTEDESGNVTEITKEIVEDKPITLIMDNEDECGTILKEEVAVVEDADGDSGEEVEEGLEEALRDVKVMKSLLKRRKSGQSATHPPNLKRKTSSIVSSSDSEEEEVYSKLNALLQPKSDETPVLTVPDKLDEGNLTDVESIDE